MNKYIIVSKKAADYIDLPEDNHKNVILSEDIISEITKLVNSYKQIFAVLFIHIHELDAIDMLLIERYNYTEISYRIAVFGSEDQLDRIDSEKLQRISDIRISEISFSEFNLLVNKAFLQIEGFYKYKMQNNEDFTRLINMKQDQEDLINIGKSLSTEKDPDELLKMILIISKKITGADAGSIYITEEHEDERKQLRFKYSDTFNRDLPLEEFTLPINKDSIAGYVAMTGEVLNIPDAYNLSPDDPIRFNTSFDKDNNYISRSMLVVPMRNHIDEIIGVIQLINSKEDINGNKRLTGNEAFEIRLERPEDFYTYVVPFDSRYEDLLEAVAGQAGIAIENNRMMKQIQNQFESFVKASVSAIESRDIATSGHSFRVAEICKKMATAINNIKDEPFGDLKFTANEIKELEYAALLHDFGKVYIDINIFKKAKKLYGQDFENLILRLNYLYRFIELCYVIKSDTFPWKKDFEGDKRPYFENIDTLNEEMKTRLDTIMSIRDKIKELNEPSVKEENPEKILADIQEKINQIDCFDIDGNRLELLNENEVLNLKIKRGSLNPYERKEIESHVIQSYNFVINIPWPPEYSRIPEIILNHHEKLDGTGYPYGFKENEIPIQSKIMAIADIYDALVASDRPYKKSVDKNIALSILSEESDNNKIDKDLLNIFIQNQIYKDIYK